MNRRTLLKGAAATAAANALSTRRPGRSFAAGGQRRTRLTPAHIQLPYQYEIISFFVSDEFIPANGQNFRGVARDITDEGTIIGDVVAGGMLRPAIWNASLEMSFLDLGEYQSRHATTGFANDTGRVIGAVVPLRLFMTEEQVAALSQQQRTEIWDGKETEEAGPLLWTNWQFDSSLSRSLSPKTVFNTLTESNVLAGSIDLVPARWIDDVAQLLDAQPGYDGGGGFRAVNRAGDTAGTIYVTREPSTGGRPMLWTHDGELTVFDPPMGTPADWNGGVAVYSLDDERAFVAVVREDGQQFGWAYRSDGGEQVPIADLGGAGMFLRDANMAGVLIGQSMLNGYSIPTIWVNDQPIAVADMIIPGPDLLLLSVEGINESGAMVGTAQDSAGLAHHVLLRPV